MMHGLYCVCTSGVWTCDLFTYIINFELEIELITKKDDFNNEMQLGTITIYVYITIMAVRSTD